MNDKAAGIVSKIAELERELEKEFERGLERKRRQFRYSLEKGKIAFECEACAIHDRLVQSVPAYLREAPPASLLVAPVIYSLIVPLALLDLWLWLYQSICFPVYGIARAERSRYIVLDRGHLRYLNWIERFNCNYCGYANGLVAYAREVSSRTEQYFCPIKHAARCAGTHSRYREFLEFGDAAGYKKELKRLRADLK